MPIYSKKGYRILLVHIPKTGGTSISKMLTSTGWKEEKKKGKNDSGIYGAHATWEIYDEWGEFDYRFSIVREPIERLKSNFLHACHGTYMKNLMMKEFRLAKIVSGGKEESANVVKWKIKDELLERFFDKLEEDPTYFGNHMRRQSDFINENDRSIEIFKYPSSIKEIPLALSAKFGFPAGKVRHWKNSKRRKSKKPKFTESQVEMIREFYREDYRRFFNK